MARAQAEAMLNRNLGDTTFMHEIIMGYQGEMSLKGLNRNQFESAMMKILRYRLKTVANRLDIARGQCAFHSDRLETHRIYTPATRNGSLNADRQCIRPFGNVQLAVSRRNAVFVSPANPAVLFHAGCLDRLD